MTFTSLDCFAPKSTQLLVGYTHSPRPNNYTLPKPRFDPDLPLTICLFTAHNPTAILHSINSPSCLAHRTFRIKTAYNKTVPLCVGEIAYDACGLILLD